MWKKIALASLALLIGFPAIAQDIVLKPEHPTNYVIKKGDTLWDIASRFLRDPWRWPDIWYVNPQIQNPHLIYPGDEVVLTFKDGKPQLELRRSAERGSLRTVKLSPEIRRESIARAIPAIPTDAIMQFLTRPGVITDDAYDDAPYIVSSEDEHLIMGSGDRIFVRGLDQSQGTRFKIVRKDDVYRAGPGKKGDVLGYEALYVGEAVVERFGQPAVLRITRAEREALLGDRLLPADIKELGENFVPHGPATTLDGHIIGVVDGISRIGQYQTVVLDLGSTDGVQRGHVLAVDQAGGEVRDKIAGGRKRVALPDQRAGYVLVFRTFDRVSYALVMKAERDMRVYDMVRTP